MITCPKCKYELMRGQEGLTCPTCHAEYKAVDGVQVLLHDGAAGD